MENETSRFNRQILTWAILGIAIVTAFGVGSFVQNDMSWGIVSVRPVASVTVSGYAEQDEKNQIAYYSAGVNSTNVDKDTAVSEVNTGVAEIIRLLEEFGIPKSDIQTQSVSIYRMERPPFEGDAEIMMIAPDEPRGRTPSTGDKDAVWQASNSLEITLREVDRAGELADLLASTGATNVYGPTFSLDDREKTEEALLEAAIINAREKAEKIAASSGRRLGKIEHVIEGGSSGDVYPMYARAESAMGMGGGFDSAIEPGTTQVAKTVTVTFSLR